MKRKLIWTAALVIVVGAIGFKWLKREKEEAPSFQFAPVTMGKLQSTVSSTGTLNAVGTVSVGTQVSGTISARFADFNDRVRKGQKLAVLDTTVLGAAVRDANAALDRAQAQADQALADYNRAKPLFDKGYLSQQEFQPLQTNLTVTKSAVSSAQSALQRAQTNLSYSTIVSPIDGTVISRNIDAGQTVAASFNTPTLFEIAEDLSKMQIFATVDESDIGNIRVGQAAKFSVQAYPDESLPGVVSQIRMKPTNISNVVNYTVVVDALNKDGKLLPGMTATIDFIMTEVDSVLKVPNGALRFEPDEKDLVKMGRKLAMADSVGHHGRRGKGGDNPHGGFSPDIAKHEADHNDKSFGRLWYLDDAGDVAPLPVKLGITDGRMTEVSSRFALKEGLNIITGIVRPSAKNKAATSLFPGGGPRGPRGGHF